MLRKRSKISITPDPSVVDWLDKRTGGTLRWKDRTHAFEWSVGFLMRQSERFGELEEFERFVREAGDEWLKAAPSAARMAKRGSGEVPPPPPKPFTPR